MLDVENLCGVGRPSAADLRLVHRAYMRVVGPAADDLTVIGGGPRTTLDAYQEWRGARFVMRPGTDGADLALLEVLTTERIPERFTHVVLGSGDGIFADVVADLAADGCHVTVVGRHGDIAKRLRIAARDVRYLDLPTGQPASLPRKASA